MDLSSDNKKKEFIKQLIAIECIKTGNFTLKSGKSSKYYVNLRDVTYYPETFKLMVELIKERIQNDQKQVVIAGVPYGVVPVAGAVAYSCELAYHPIRKEVKDYGLANQDSGVKRSLDHILIEDVMSSGSSLVETITKMSGRKITDIIVVVNRESGGDEKLKEEFPEIRVHSIVKISEILELNGELDK